MNGDVVQQRPMSPQQLRAVVYKIARTYLEVERGLRPPDHLATFLSPDEYRRHRITPRAPAGVVRPVRPPDIGRVRIDLATSDRVDARALVRGHEDRWSMLLVDLCRVGRGWQVEKLDRLERLISNQPREVEVASNDMSERVRRLEGERRSVATAYEAVSNRIERIGDRRTKAARALAPELDRWAKRLDELDTEASNYARTIRLHEELGTADRLQGGHDRHRTDDAGTAQPLLGPRPEDPCLGPIWDDAVECLDAYRARWGLSAGDPIPRVTGDEQAAERRELVDRLREAVRAVGATGLDHGGHIELAPMPTGIEL